MEVFNEHGFLSFSFNVLKENFVSKRTNVFFRICGYICLYDHVSQRTVSFDSRRELLLVLNMKLYVCAIHYPPVTAEWRIQKLAQALQFFAEEDPASTLKYSTC